MLKHSQLSRTEQQARMHYFRLFRARQKDAPILAVWISALRHVRFVDKMHADVRAHSKRSKAAKKAWEVRKSQSLAIAKAEG